MFSHVTLTGHEASGIEFVSSFISFVDFHILLFHAHSGTVSTAVGTNCVSAVANDYVVDS